MEYEAALKAIRKGLRWPGGLSRLVRRGDRGRLEQTGRIQPATPPPKKRRLMSPLTRRILAVNVVALLIPIGGLLYVGPDRTGDHFALAAQGFEFRIDQVRFE